MPITLGHNLNSLRAISQLNKSTSAVNKVYERLSTGMRINGAADDPAGLAMALSLKADSRISAQAIRNVNDGISMLNIAEGALDELSAISIRISELATQASTGTISAKQRQALNLEAQALNSEYTRIIESTEFNGINLLNETTSSVSIQAGAGSNTRIDLDLNFLKSEHGDGTFNTGISQSVGLNGNTRELDFADFNDDGNLDIVIADDTTGTFSVELGNGNGTFGARLSYASGNRVYDVESADVNNDGIMDVITSNYSTSSGGAASFIKTHLGNGDGTFQNGITSSGASYSWFMKSGDLNGDGLTDLIVSESYSQRLAIMIGDGSGNFTKTGTLSDGLGALNYQLDIADFNGDGYLDVLGGGSQISLYLGNGNGTFAKTTPNADPSGASYVTAGDINGDGIVDFASIGSGTIRSMIGNGDGTFRLASSVAIADPMSELQITDMNGDGYGEIIVSISAATSKVLVLNSNGDGTFQAPLTLTGLASSNIYPSTARAVDLNNDGALDVVHLESLNHTVKVWTGNPVPGTVIGLGPVDLSSLRAARDTMTSLAERQDSLQLARGKLGAYSARLSMAGSMLEAARINTDAAYSRIMDADIAEEAAKLLALQILQQSGAAILAQSNQNSKLALQLLT